MAFTFEEIHDHIVQVTSPSYIGSKPAYDGDSLDSIDSLLETTGFDFIIHTQGDNS